MKTAYFDCFSGISGDMILGALLDCGLPLSHLQREMDKLPLQGYRLSTNKVIKNHLAATDLVIEINESPRCRHLPDIQKIIAESELPDPVKEKSLAVFETLAWAEARVHGTTIDKIHFHEVGALDSIIDIVGGVCALYLLGIERVYASPLPLGEGMINISHGTVPVPAPATLEILQRRSVPVYSRGVTGELVTPTGAAILCTLAEDFGPLPPMHLMQLGYGAGKRDYHIPNLLRVLVGDSPDSESISYEPLNLLEANIDDLNPEIYNYVLERLFQEGALDVYFTPIQMKKNRPAIKLTALAHPDKAQSLTHVLFQETSTLGVRVLYAEKAVLPRRVIEVETPWGGVRVKVAGEPGQHFNFAPEYEDCYAIAQREGIPLKEVYKTAEYAFHQHTLWKKPKKD